MRQVRHPNEAEDMRKVDENIIQIMFMELKAQQLKLVDVANAKAVIVRFVYILKLFVYIYQLSSVCLHFSTVCLQFSGLRKMSFMPRQTSIRRSRSQKTSLHLSNLYLEESFWKKDYPTNSQFGKFTKRYICVKV